MTKAEAIDRLIKKGATHEKKEDHFGDTKSGWWMDTNWLAPYGKPQDAIREIEFVGPTDVGIEDEDGYVGISD